ncbi:MULTISPECIES: hypothetical protein [unclassified Neisseria]|uniref:hypothetical protein n=1 Tax=unclassified Neisseria TaxID=2623750 RepID=UPI0026658EB0|nr:MULTISPECIES: hypothetical protein [unclassified Neisseria]MDO1510914.1 hypothetical protein [Neisseria sp. MVDL19-042950]MDO1516863.1 hypothetical protein [Neisseria sp. MVDL18-041461]MDO1563925.1 hypothetical protein [Neisseria sp. MVDL20-010259]
MSILKSVLRGCLLLLMSCTQAEHVEKTKTSNEDISPASEISQSETKQLIPIDEVVNKRKNFTGSADFHILDLLKATDVERIECQYSKESTIQNSQSIAIIFRGLSDRYIQQWKIWEKVYAEIIQLSKSKKLSFHDLESTYLVLNAYSLKDKSKHPISIKKVGEVYVSPNSRIFEIRLLDGTSAHIEVFKDIPYYHTDNEDAEHDLTNAPEYSPYYFRFWFDGDREKQTCRLKYDVFVD